MALEKLNLTETQLASRFVQCGLRQHLRMSELLRLRCTTWLPKSF